MVVHAVIIELIAYSMINRDVDLLNSSDLLV